jgi:LacI family transcriptional regulator
MGWEMNSPAFRSSKQGIRAVAARAGVSTASVSRALNNPAAVSASLRARIAQAIEAVGYIPHAPARILSSRRSRTLGAIVPTIDNTMFARGIASLQKYLSSVGYMLFLTTSNYDLEIELQQARNLVGRGVDGLVLRGDCHHDGLRKMLADNAVPFINVGIYQPDRPYPTTIYVPTAETWQRAGEYLVRHLAGEQAIMHHEVDYSLVVRESTAPPSRTPK